MPVDVPPPGSVFVNQRPHGAHSPVECLSDQLDSDLAADTAPWRTFRWFKGQKHYSGTFRSATEQDHVGYESRLELTRLLLTDSGPVVVDVKPAALVARPRTAFTFAWTRRTMEARGWRYEVLEWRRARLVDNVRLLAGYRRGWLFDPELREQHRRR